MRRWLAGALARLRARAALRRDSAADGLVPQNHPEEEVRSAPAPQPPPAPSRVVGKTEPRIVTDAIMGIDFGTSSSKIVVRTPFIAGGRALAVPLISSPEAGRRYLVPTVLAEGRDGALVLPDGQGNGATLSRLKVDLMSDPNNPDVQARAAAYIALLVRRSESWFHSSQRSTVGDRELRWHWNLGIPSAGYDDEGIRKGFLRTLEAARKLAGSEGPLLLKDARRVLDACSDPDSRLAVIPEVVAEVVGYARSASRIPGLHVVVDVGASTLDVCGFVLGDYQGEQVYALLTASVERRGLHELHRARLIGLQAVPPNALDPGIMRVDLSNPLARIPDSIREYLLTSENAPAGVGDVDTLFLNECTRQVMQCLGHLRKRRCWSAPNWAAGVPTFIAGGGAWSNFYEKVVSEASRRCVRSWDRVAPLRKLRLPVPPQLANEDLTEEVFARLGVAFGLSFDSLDIGFIFPPHKIPDEEPRRVRASPGFISKDEV